MMKKLGMLIAGNRAPRNCLLLALAAMALVVTGCPHNDYSVELKPQGDRIERTLIFYCADGVNTNTGQPNYQSFDPAELAVIAALYPAGGLTNDGDRHVAHGEFTNQLPADVGGAGFYTHCTSTLGEAGFYAERFRGNDDLAGMTERRLQAADRLTDLILGWSKMELGTDSGYDRLRRFLDGDFRRDVKNLATYWWDGQLASAYQTNADEEFAVRFGQYLWERGYFTVGEIPALFDEMSGNDSTALMHRIQRLVARQMGVPESAPIPVSLAFLADEAAMEKSFDQYLAGTALYRAKLAQWEADKKLKPDAKPPAPDSVVDDALGELIPFDLFGRTDHLSVRLSLASAPVHSNGRWDAARKQVVWETDLAERTNATHIPFACYASWAQPDEVFQKAHFGKTVLVGDELTQYCLWRSRLEPRQGTEWDAFLSGLQPGAELVAKLGAFRFSGEAGPAGTTPQPQAFSPSAFPRQLLTSALR